MLQFITHTNSKFGYLESAIEALKGGCKWIQLRMKEMPEDEIEKTALHLKEVCRQYNATFIIDDQVELAKKIGADGVHLGKSDLSPDKAREILGREFIIGGTANTYEDMERLARLQVDYIGLGPFRFTDTKKNLSPVLGLDGYSRILNTCKNNGIDIPVVAIGGITREDIPALMKTGIHGIALSGTILNAENPQEETEEIMDILKNNIL